MHAILKKLKEEKAEASFLFPSVPKPIKGKVIRLSDEVVVVESKAGASTFEYLCHPSNVCIVQKQAP